MTRLTGEGAVKRRAKEDMVDIIYSLECLEGRWRGVRRQYLGESSRSRYQMYKEHLRKIESCHVIHCMEEHKGEMQEVLFRVISKHQTLLYRQVQESVIIEERAWKPADCLNLKNECGGSKLLGET